MLVLTRCRNERIVIVIPDSYQIPKGGARVDVFPVEIRGDKVRIGLEGPQEITFNRQEVQEQIDSEASGTRNGEGESA